jgi:trans-aconitate 2-methyltransferase
MKNRNTDWNPELYLHFKNERTRPAIDLVNRIDINNPEKIIDIGCGPGNSTGVLMSKWPNARIMGIDNSAAMIKKASETYPDQQWQVKDGKDIDDSTKYDIVFSNAVIHWIPDHESLFEKLLNITKEKGVLAVQMPLYLEMPVAILADKIFKQLFPDNKFNIKDLITINPGNYYFNLLDSKINYFYIWETSYFHIMDSAQKIYEMVETTGIKPYLDRIPNDDDRSGFRKSVIDGISHAYKAEKSGKVIFPFKRLFIIASKQE